MNPRVFMAEKPRTADVSAAERHGKLVTLFGPRHRQPSPLSMTQYAEAAAERFSELGFDPLQDFFVMSGGGLQVAACVAALQAMHGSFRVLVFAAHLSDYLERDFTCQNIHRSSRTVRSATGTT